MRLHSLLLALALPCALIPLPAEAQPESVREALELGYEGDRLYAQGRWAEAYERFAAADARAHSPVFTLYMARCRKNAGRLLEATTIYQRVAREPLPANASKPFRDAVSDARTELAETERRTPSVKVVVKGPGSASATISIDGKAAQADTVTRLDPGSHTVAASSGRLKAEQAVTLTEGGDPKTIELELGAATGEAPSKGATPPPGGAEERGSTVPAWIALSIGVVGLGVGAVTGGLAASKAGKVKEGCIDEHCLPEDAEDLDAAKTLATISTIGFIAGGVGVAAAGVLFVVRPGGGPTKTGVAAPAWISVQGRF